MSTDRLDKISDTLVEIKVVLAKNTESLSHHIERTAILESEVKRLHSDVTKLRGFFSISGWVIAIAATLLTVLSKLKPYLP